MHTQNCSVDQYSAIPYTQNMRVEWKTVTGDPQVTKKLKDFANVLQMQHQPEACTLDLSDDQSRYLSLSCVLNVLGMNH